MTKTSSWDDVYSRIGLSSSTGHELPPEGTLVSFDSFEDYPHVSFDASKLRQPPVTVSRTSVSAAKLPGMLSVVPESCCDTVL